MSRDPRARDFSDYSEAGAELVMIVVLAPFWIPIILFQGLLFSIGWLVINSERLLSLRKSK